MNSSFLVRISVFETTQPKAYSKAPDSRFVLPSVQSRFLSPLRAIPSSTDHSYVLFPSRVFFFLSDVLDERRKVAQVMRAEMTKLRTCFDEALRDIGGLNSLADAPSVAAAAAIDDKLGK